MYRIIGRSGVAVESLPENYDGHLAEFEASVRWLQTMTDADRTIFALDHSPVAKKKLMPAYKANRKSGVFDPRISILKMLRANGAETAEKEGEEADDVIASLACDLHEAHRITIASCDADLWAVMVLPNCDVYNFQSRRFASRERLLEKYGIDGFNQIALVKTLWGDISDNIPNELPRLQRKLLPIIRASGGDLGLFLEQVAASPNLSPELKSLVEGKREILLIHNEIITLHFGCEYILKSS